METLLTNFEELENWRVNETKKIFFDFADTLITISNKFVEGFTNFTMYYPDLPLHLDSTGFSDFEQFRSAETDEFFQVWRVHPLTSKFLPLEELFVQEKNNGGQIFIVTDNYNGPPGFLNVLEGERVVAIQQKDNYFICKNINMCIGLLPTNILKFI